jgi:hypothetical protein
MAVEIDLALTADAATIDGSGKLNVLGVFDRIAAASFPVQHGRIALVLRFAGGFEDAGTHRVVLRLSGPKGEEVVRINGSIQLPPGAAAAGGRVKVPHVLNLDGLVFQEPGAYSLDVSVDGEHQVALALQVVRVGGGAAA